MGELSFRLSERARREWRILPLQELLLTPKKALISGPFGSNISSKYFVEDGVPVIRGNNLSANVGTRFIDEGFVFLTQEKADELGTWAVTGDIVLTAAGTIGQIGIISERLKHKSYIISNKQIRARLNQDIVDFLFCYYWLSTDYMREVIESSNTGSTIPLINLTVVRGLEFPVPEKPEQEAIVEVLSSLDDKIDLLHRQNKTLESLAETLFRHWFIDGAQDDWEVKPLKDICIIRNGYAFKSETYETDGQKIIRTMNFKSGYVEENSLVFVSDELAKTFSSFWLKRSDFLLVMVGASLGNFAIVTSEVLPALQNQNMWCFRATSEGMQHYLNHALRSIIAENLHGASGSARSFFQKGAFYELLMKVPNENVISDFNEYSEGIFSKIEFNRGQIKGLEKLRDTLLPKLMSGDVRVDYEAAA